MNNKYNPAYDFLGYKILKIKLNREKDGDIENFSVQVIKGEYNANEQIYNCLIRVKLQFENCEKSEILFLSGYKIYDNEWFLKLEETNKNNMFFSIAFPYIREKINSICDDCRNPFRIPVIDLRQLNVNNEILFNATK